MVELLTDARRERRGGRERAAELVAKGRWRWEEEEEEVCVCEREGAGVKPGEREAEREDQWLFPKITDVWGGSSLALLPLCADTGSQPVSSAQKYLSVQVLSHTYIHRHSPTAFSALILLPVVLAGDSTSFKLLRSLCRHQIPRASWELWFQRAGVRVPPTLVTPLLRGHVKFVPSLATLLNYEKSFPNVPLFVFCL